MNNNFSIPTVYLITEKKSINNKAKLKTIHKTKKQISMKTKLIA